MSLGEICNRQVVVIGREASLRDAVRHMREHHVGDLVVVEGTTSPPVPVGILTDRDIVIEVLAQDVEPETVCVGDVMSRDLLTAREEDDLLDTVKAMRARGVRRLPVLDRQGRLAGIVTFDDLVELLAEQLTDLARLVSNEQTRESNARS